MDATRPAERFEEHRIRLRADAYRMLGSLSQGQANTSVKQINALPTAGLCQSAVMANAGDLTG
jgi:hypothetical protein